MNVISNTTVLSNFAAVGRLDVLRSLLDEIYLSADVLAEIQDGLVEGCDFYGGIENHIHPFSPDGWLRLTSLEGEAELRLFGQLPGALHRGESSCLAIAIRRGWALLTDDAYARKVAHRHAVTVSGTLGVLTQAIAAELLTLDEANSLLGRMIQAGYRSPHYNLTDLL